MVYVDPKNIVDVIEQQNLRIREQEAQIAALEAEVQRLRKLAPWHDRPRAVVKPPNLWKGRYCRVLPRERGDRDGIVRVLIEGRCYPYEFGEGAIEYVQEPTSE